MVQGSLDGIKRKTERLHCADAPERNAGYQNGDSGVGEEAGRVVGGCSARCGSASYTEGSEMIGLISVGDRVRVIDRMAGHYGQVGVVEKVEPSQCSIRMPDGRLILRSTYIERVAPDGQADPWSADAEAGFLLGILLTVMVVAILWWVHRQ